MDWRDLTIRVVAVIGAVVQDLFTYLETRGWGADFVKSAAPTWTLKQPLELPPLPSKTAEAMKCRPFVEGVPPEICYAISWATDLAWNIGIYNLVLAIGLLWVAVAGASVARTLGIFLGVWLLIAAAAALGTEVYSAFKAQGSLGILVLVTSIWAGHREDGNTSPRVRAA
jgi:hypothetical protein